MERFVLFFLIICAHNQLVFAESQRCDTRPGNADSHLLALSWQPGFCQTYGYEAGKPECIHLPKTSYQANHLTLHGLWPNQNDCGVNYGFCEARPRANHCDYEPVDLNPEVGKQLKKLMPSYQFGSCLERHEWNKHGTCQLLTTDDYFALAMRLTEEADNTAFGQYLTENRGQTVTMGELRTQIALSFGEDNVNKVYLGCKNGFLVDVFIALPAHFSLDESLVSLVSQAADYSYKNGCTRKITISAFSKNTWF